MISSVAATVSFGIKTVILSLSLKCGMTVILSLGIKAVISSVAWNQGSDPKPESQVWQ